MLFAWSFSMRHVLADEKALSTLSTLSTLPRLFVLVLLVLVLLLLLLVLRAEVGVDCLDSWTSRALASTASSASVSQPNGRSPPPSFASSFSRMLINTFFALGNEWRRRRVPDGSGKT
jgi:hypothetical protein